MFALFETAEILLEVMQQNFSSLKFFFQLERKLLNELQQNWTELHDFSFPFNKRQRSIYQSIENWNVGLSDERWLR